MKCAAVRVRGARSASCRAVIGVALVAALVLLQVVIVVSVVGGGLQQDLTLQRIETTRAFYAAEAGASMALREAWLALDEDGDGAIGTVSDEGDASNDPEIGSARVFVSVSEGGGGDTYVSVGRTDRTRRRVEVALASD